MPPTVAVHKTARRNRSRHRRAAEDHRITIEQPKQEPSDAPCRRLPPSLCRLQSALPHRHPTPPPACPGLPLSHPCPCPCPCRVPARRGRTSHASPPSLSLPPPSSVGVNHGTTPLPPVFSLLRTRTPPSHPREGERRGLSTLPPRQQSGRAQNRATTPQSVVRPAPRDPPSRPGGAAVRKTH